jgi:hypothetical protein
VAVQPYQYPQLLKDELECQCEDMLTQGIIRPCTSLFSSPVLLVKKADSSWCFCIDCRSLNENIIKDKFPTPIVDELLDELRGAKFFTKIDLHNSYHQARMHPADIEKVTFYTHQGHFEFTIMPFGLTNAPTTFQALMNKILASYIWKFILVFFDDILIYSSTWVEHLQHVKVIFKLMRVHHFFLKQSKCVFGSSSVNYLGPIISADGIATDADKVATINSWPPPCTLWALQGFLGLVDYYRKFITKYEDVALPLTALLKWDAFCWSKEAEQVFYALKQALISTPILQLLDFDRRFIVDCDASGSGIGVVLHQGDDPIAFFCRAVPAHHAKLLTYERELIGLVKAIRHWRPYL